MGIGVLVDGVGVGRLLFLQFAEKLVHTIKNRREPIDNYRSVEYNCYNRLGVS